MNFAQIQSIDNFGLTVWITNCHRLFNMVNTEYLRRWARTSFFVPKHVDSMERTCFFCRSSDSCSCPLAIDSRPSEKRVSLILTVHLKATVILKVIQ